MAPRNKEPEKAIEQINQQVNDGGGCTETWEALSRIRNSVSRRKFVKGVGSVGLGGVVASRNTTAKTRSEGYTVELTGKERVEAATIVQNDDKVEKIRKLFVKNKWHPDLSNAKYLQLNPENHDSFRGAILPFEISPTAYNSPTISEQRVLVWLEDTGAINGKRVSGYQLTQKESILNSKSKLNEEHIEPIHEQSYTVSSSGLSTKVHSMTKHPMWALIA